MSPRWSAFAKALLYPLFYLFCLVVGIIVSFPWDQVKHRIEAEFAKSQAAKGPGAWRLEIGELDGYWLTGVEIKNAKIIIPPDAESSSGAATSTSRPKSLPGADEEEGDPGDAGDDADEAAGAKAKVGPLESTLLLEEGHARVRILPLLIGRVRVDFSMTALGGEVSGTVPVGGGDFDVELDSVDLGQLVPLKDLVSLPVQGVASGRLTLSAADGKFSKASGALDLTVKDVVLGDGKAKLAGKMALPPAQLGTIEIGAKAENGVLTLEKLDAQGRDGEIHGAGTVRLRQPWDMSVADVYLRFGFTDEYRSTNDKTKALLGEPGQEFPPPLLDQDRKMKRAKRTDGLYGFRIHGRLRALKFDPTTADGPKPSKTAAAGAEADDAADDDAAKSAQFSATNRRKTRKPSNTPKITTPRATATSVERPSAPEPAREEPAPRIPEQAPAIPEAAPAAPQPPPEPEPPPAEPAEPPAVEEAPAPAEDAPAPQ